MTVNKRWLGSRLGQIRSFIMFTLHKNIPSVIETLKNSKLPESELLLKAYKDSDITSDETKDSSSTRASFIVFEGLDGSGKTLISQKVASAIGAVIKTTPPEGITSLRDTFDKQPTPLRRAYYAFGNYLAGKEVEKLTLQNTPVVMDRFWHSTAAYTIGHQSEGRLENLPPIGDIMYKWPVDLIKPDVVIYLNVSENVRIARLSNRSALTEEETQIKKDTQMRLIIEKAYIRMSDPGVVVVDADKSVEKVLQDCLKVVHSLRKNGN